MSNTYKNEHELFRCSHDTEKIASYIKVWSHPSSPLGRDVKKEKDVPIAISFQINYCNRVIWYKKIKYL